MTAVRVYATAGIDAEQHVQHPSEHRGSPFPVRPKPGRFELSTHRVPVEVTNR
jgi:hypothetical protein